MSFASSCNKFFVNSLGANRQHVIHMHTNANVQLRVQQTNKDRAHLERNRVLSTCLTRVPASALEMF